MKKKLELNEIQLYEFNILQNFTELCKSNNLTFSLAYGTMLGAVRHKGFIPWDDDIDVFMYRQDYDKLINLIKNGKYDNSRYEVVDYTIDKSYNYEFAKMYDKKTILIEKGVKNYTLGVYIDIFPLDDFPVNNKICVFINELLLKFIWCSVKQINTGSLKVKLIKICIFPFFKLIGTHQWIRLHANFIKLFENKYNTVVNATYKISDFIEKNELDKFTELYFENTKLPVYQNYESILKSTYGDFMTLPPIENRKTHDMEAYTQ